jgi:hypothetical protein
MSYDPNQPQQPPYGQPPQWGQQPYGQPPPTQYPPQYGGVPPVPGYVQPQQQPKRSLRWLWITLGIVGGILVLGCAGCVILSVVGVNLFGQVVAPVTTSTQYYQAIKDQDYGKAYSYLDPNIKLAIGSGSVPVPATQQLYTQSAQGIDQEKGPVTSFTIKSFNVNGSDATVVVSVTRSSGTYEVTLQLKQEGSDWKITSFSNI